MGGLIAVACGDTGRYSAFAEALARLDKPTGTNVLFAKGGDREVSRNKLVGVLLGGPYEWLLFLDDDSLFAEDLLTRLLAHQLDIVGGLYLRRDKPFSPIAYEDVLDDGRLVPLDLRKHMSDALVPVRAVGTGAMLVRRRVFETMPGPWFRRDDAMTEDMIFCLECGFPVHVDLAARVGHMTTATVWPSTADDGGWAVGFTITEQINFLTKV